MKQVGKGYRHVLAGHKGGNQQQALQASEFCTAAECFVSCAQESRHRGESRGWVMAHTSTAVCLQSLHTSHIAVPKGANWNKVKPGLVCRQEHVCRHTSAHTIIVRHRDADLYFVCCPYGTQSHKNSMAQAKWETCPNFSLSWEETTGSKGPTS